MSKHDDTKNRTIQDDRAELGTELGPGSPLAEGEGEAMLANEQPATERPATGFSAPLGGAPVPLPGGATSGPTDRLSQPAEQRIDD